MKNKTAFEILQIPIQKEQSLYMSLFSGCDSFKNFEKIKKNKIFKIYLHIR